MATNELKRILNKEIPASKSNSFFVSLAVFISALLFSLSSVGGSLGLFDFLKPFKSEFVGIFIQVFILGIIPFYIIKLGTKNSYKQMFINFGFKKLTLKSTLYSIALGPICFVGVVIASGLFQTLISFFGYSSPFASSDSITNWWTFLIQIVLTAVMPAIFEEIFNRGFSLWGFKRYGIKYAVLITSFIFAFMHFNINQVFFTFLLGLVICNLRVISKSILPCIIIHFINNFLSVLLSFTGLYGGVVELLFGGNIFFVLVKCLIVGFAVLVGISFCTAKIFSHEKDKELKDNVYLKALSIMPAENSDFKLVENKEDVKTLESMGIKRTNEEFEGEAFLEMKKVVTGEFNAEQLKKAGSLENFMMGVHLENEEEIKKFKKEEVLTKTFILGTIVLGAIITLWTFIWGLI